MKMEHAPQFNQEKPQDSKKEFSAAQQKFVNGILRVGEVTTLEEARNANWRFDGVYKSESRSPESTNYRVATNEDNEKEITPEINRRCTICHQPNIKNVSLVSVNGQVVQVGCDCASKLLRFIDTGEIISESSIKKINDDQIDIFIDVLKDDDEDIEKTKRTKTKIVASMLSWLNDHINDEDTPEDIKYLIHTYNNVGMMPNNDSARKVAEYYKSARKFLPAEILNKEEHRSLDNHPHRKLLRNVIRSGLIQNKIPQLKRILVKGLEINQQRVDRKNKKYEEFERARFAKIREDNENKEREKEERKMEQREKRLKARKILGGLFEDKIVNKGSFNSESNIRWPNHLHVIDQRLDNNKYGLRVGYDFINENTTETTRDSFFKILDDYNYQLYKLTHGTDYKISSEYTPGDYSYFINTENSKTEIKEIYTKDDVEEINNKISNGEIRTTREDIQSAIDKIQKTPINVTKHVCAPVVINLDTMQPVVKLRNGWMPLDQAIKEGKVIN